MKILSTNKEAFFNYHIEDTFQAGVVLTGDEIKSIRKGFGAIKDAFVTVHDGQAFVINWYITPYSHAYTKDDVSKNDGRRSRVLLLNKREIDAVMGAISRKGLTALPLKMYLSDKNLVKLEIGLAKHKKLIDKRNKIKERESEREMKRELKYRAS